MMRALSGTCTIIAARNSGNITVLFSHPGRRRRDPPDGHKSRLPGTSRISDSTSNRVDPVPRSCQGDPLRIPGWCTRTRGIRLGWPLELVCCFLLSSNFVVHFGLACGDDVVQVLARVVQLLGVDEAFQDHLDTMPGSLIVTFRYLGDSYLVDPCGRRDLAARTRHLGRV